MTHPVVDSVRGAGIRALKRLVWLSMRTRVGANLIRLATEERQLFLHDQRLKQIWDEAESHLGRRVLSGPFAGLEYPTLRSSGSAIFPKIVGSYEQELHPLIESLFAEKYRTIVDIGAAEGYYAIGLARRFPSARVVAFEAEPEAHRMLGELALTNHVADRLVARGRCEPPGLAALDLSGLNLIVSDCEGAEITILDPQRVPDLANCDLVIELHTARGLKVGSLFQRRFDSTHDVSLIDVATRDPDAYPVLKFLSRSDRETLLYEGPRQLGWAYCRARNRSAL